MSYIGLHNHSHYSNFRLRDSTNKIPDMIEYARSLGHKGIAITEHECITSSLEVIKYYYNHKELAEEGFKCLLGNEIYLCNNSVNEENKVGAVFPHFIVIALNATGHEKIRELSTKAWSNSFMHVMMRVPTYYEDLIEIMDNGGRGNIVGSSACLGGSLPRKLLEYDTTKDEDIWLSCVEWVNWMNDLFGQGYFFLEMQTGETEEQIVVNKLMVELSKETNTPYIITTDAHYLKKEDKEIHKIFLNSQEGDREVDSFYNTTYIMSEKEIHDYMDKYLGVEVVQKGLDNTVLVYDMAEMYDLRKPLHIPYCPLDTSEPDKKLYEKYVELVPLLKKFYESEHACDRHLVRELVKTMEKDPCCRDEKACRKITTCLESILVSSEAMNVRWSAYLLQIAIFVDLMWKNGITVGAGRGSGVGFIVLHMLGIIQINPARETVQTYEFRFLNPERSSVLDIDLDVPGYQKEHALQVLKDTYGEDRISKVLTIGKEKSRSAILTASRGLGTVDNDLAQYMASLIISDRGTDRSLHTMYYGDDENKPVQEFVALMDEYPEVWETACKIEGLINSAGSHAGGVILVDEPFTKSTALMKTNSGDVITQYDLHTAEDVSLIKVDMLNIEALDKMDVTLKLLLKDNVIQWQNSWKETYEKYIGIYNLERNAKDMWKMLWNHQVLSLFQFEKDSGIHAIEVARPESVDDLAALNSVMRLMAQEKGGESPLDKYARFKNDITQWYQEMDDWELTLEEQEMLKEILGGSYGICEAQEYLFLLTMHPKIAGWSLGKADKLRKMVAKKNPKGFLEMEQEFYENIEEKGLSYNLCNYVWRVLIGTQRGYGFNRSHTLSYSLIGLQELNLAYRYPIIYWNCANLIVDSGSMEETEGKSTDYGKVAVAVAKIQNAGTKIELPLINEAEKGFVPKADENRIIYSLKAINGIGDDAVELILNNRPYDSFEDFCSRMVDSHTIINENGEEEKIPSLLKNSQVIKLIKAGCFNELLSNGEYKDRKAIMIDFFNRYIFSPNTSLTMSNFNKILEYNMLPEKLETILRIKNFKDYILHESFLVKEVINEGKKIPKCGYHDRLFITDEVSTPFFMEHFSDDCVEELKGDKLIISEKKFTKEWNKKIQPLKDWLAEERTLQQYNQKVFDTLWEDKVSGSMADWYMDSIGMYYEEHALEHIQLDTYGIEHFSELPEEPVPYEWYTRTINGQKKQLPKYKISRICGTVIQNDPKHYTITLLTDNKEVVNVKLNKGHFAYYNKRISTKLDPNSDKKTVLENSWLSRGSKLFLHGMRRGDKFFCKTYKDTIYSHTIYRIDSINDQGEVEVTTDRVQV